MKKVLYNIWVIAYPVILQLAMLLVVPRLVLTTSWGQAAAAAMGEMWFQFCVSALTFVILIPFYVKSGYTRVDITALKSRHAVSWIIAAVLIAVAFQYAQTYFNAVTRIARFFPMNPNDDWVNRAIKENPFLPSILATVIMAPVAEELVMRGMFLRRLNKFIPVWAAVIIQAAIFSAMHRASIYYSIWLFALGVIFGVLFIKSKSLFVPIAAHIAANFVVLYPTIQQALDQITIKQVGGFRIVYAIKMACYAVLFAVCLTAFLLSTRKPKDSAINHQ
jgi:membrane protease YdiL (CAAX protease family)